MNTQQNNSEATGSILDTIKEQTTNLERIANSNNVDDILADAIREFASKEKITREATITIKCAGELDFDKVSGLITQEWTVAKEQAPVTFWKDRENTYVQFLNKAIKEVFLEFIKAKEQFANIRDKIVAPNHEGQHITRKEVKIIMSSVPVEVQPDKLEASLKNLAGQHAKIAPIRAGKTFGGNGRKLHSLMTGVNAEGFRLLFKGIGGSIPYNDANNKIRLFPKIACKPWSCRECFYIGPNHTCEGKACAQCGNRGHQSKECTSKTRYCTNCKRPGHRARDAHCPIYTREVIRELKRMDIPIEYLENKSKRWELLKSLIYK